MSPQSSGPEPNSQIPVAAVHEELLDFTIPSVRLPINILFQVETLVRTSEMRTAARGDAFVIEFFARVCSLSATERVRGMERTRFAYEVWRNVNVLCTGREGGIRLFSEREGPHAEINFQISIKYYTVFVPGIDVVPCRMRRYASGGPERCYRGAYSVEPSSDVCEQVRSTTLT